MKNKTMKTRTTMKRCINNLSRLPALIASLSLILSDRVTAQTFTTLHSFDGSSNEAFPWGSLILSGNSLYGTADGTGANNSGAVFAVNADGTGFSTLYGFTETVGSEGISGTNGDGCFPHDGLLLSGHTLYGTTEGGSLFGSGTLFAVNTDGTGFTNLYRFTALSGTEGIAGYGTNSDGAAPSAGMILSGDTLYGTTEVGGPYGSGTLFAINTNGTGFTNLHSFMATLGSEGGYGTNSDGASPYAGLILSGNTLYGTALVGGPSGSGTVFALNTNGTGFTNLHSFSADNSPSYTNGDGGFPYGGLLLSRNTLYGTANQGGLSGGGTVFAVNTNGTDFTTLHSFSAADSPSYTNSDGAFPNDGLVLSGSTLYGTANIGGSSGNGILFAVNTNGTGFTNLHSFTAVYGTDGYNGTNSDGAYPEDALLLSGNTLYGTANAGGTYGNGTVFSLTLPVPQLTITASGTNVVLTWPANYGGIDYTGYNLLSTTNLVSPSVWAANSPAPVVVNGQLTVTNPITGAQQFYRLSQ
jgi:uncharacterized repeat protein (TIGR03803 family)